MIRDRFVATRDAVIELDTVKALIMTGGDDWRPEGVRIRGIADPTASTAIRNVDEREAEVAELRRREEYLESFIGTTMAIIEAVREGLGEDYAAILDQRYIDGLPWRDVVVDGRKVPKSTGKLKVNVAFDWIDSVGVARLLSGERGIADV